LARRYKAGSEPPSQRAVTPSRVVHQLRRLDPSDRHADSFRGDMGDEGGAPDDGATATTFLENSEEGPKPAIEQEAGKEARDGAGKGGDEESQKKEKERMAERGGGKDKERSSRRGRSRSRSKDRDRDGKRKDKDSKGDRKRASKSRSKEKKRRRSRSRSRSRSRDRKKKRSRSKSRSGKDRKKRRSRSRSRDKKDRKDKGRDKHKKGSSPPRTAAMMLDGQQMAAFGVATSKHMDMSMGSVLPGLLGPQGLGTATHIGAMNAMGLTMAPAGGEAAAAVRREAITHGGLGYALDGTSGGAAAQEDLKAFGDGGAGGQMMIEAGLERHRVQWRDSTRNARRLYVGNVNALETAQESLAVFISDKVAAAGCVPWHTKASGTRAIETCHVSEKGFAFFECTALEDAEAVLAFDGIFLNGRNIKIRRPKDYAPEENPLVQDGALDDARRRTFDAIVKPRVADSPTKIFMGNLHPDVTVTEVREVITAFGNISSMHADVDGRGRVRVGVWFDYDDPAAAAIAVPGLTGIWIKGKRLVAALATPDAEAPRPKAGGGGAGDASADGDTGVDALVSPEPQKKAPATYRVPADAEPLLYAPQRIIEFAGILSADMDEEEREGAVEDCRQECLSLGNVLTTHVEGPAVALLGDASAAAAANSDDERDDDAEDEEGNTKRPKDMTKYWGKVYIEFARLETATIAAHAFHRRSFDGRTVTVKYFPLISYQTAFGKGIPPKTHEEKQMAAIAAQEYLSNSIPETITNPKLPATWGGQMY